MTARGIPGGTGRRANNAGGISSRRLASGELRYHARLRGKHVGAFNSRAEAEAALEAAVLELAEQAAARSNAEQFEALATFQRARRDNNI